MSNSRQYGQHLRNKKKFLGGLPGSQTEVTFWVQHPDAIAGKVRRAAEVYMLLAEEASAKSSDKTFDWYFIAGIFEAAAIELESRFASP